MSTLPKLHDATLETLTFHWQEGTLQMRFSTGVNGTGVVVLEAIGVLGAAWPRLFPWGPSDAVNEVRLQQVPDRQVLSIEMQSGDVLEIQCRDVLLHKSKSSSGENRDSSADLHAPSL